MTKAHARDEWLRIAVGGPCNNRCLFCDVSGAFELPLQQFMTLVAKAHQADVKGVHLAGGEVTTRRDLKVLLRFLKLSGLPWSVETNARLFSRPEWARAFADSGLVRALVGIHGPQPVHDQVTRDASFEQTVAGVRNLLEAGVPVDGRCVLTQVLVESTPPADMVALLASLPDVTFTLVPPPPPVRIDCYPLAAAPHLGALGAWLSCFAFAADVSGITFALHGIPHCTWGAPFHHAAGAPHPRTGRDKAASELRSDPRVGPGTTTSQTHRTHGSATAGQSASLASTREVFPPTPNPLPPTVAWPCVRCARASTCPGFIPDHWPVGSIDFLEPDSRTAPGHLVMRRTGRPLRFALDVCPFKAGLRPVSRYRGESWLAEPDGTWSRWRPEHPVADEVRLDTLLVWGQLWHIGGSDRQGGRAVPPRLAGNADGPRRRPVPLVVAPQCLACHRLHECPACLVPAAMKKGHSLLPIPVEAWTQDGETGDCVLEHAWTGSLPQWARKAAKRGSGDARADAPRRLLRAERAETVAGRIDVLRGALEGPVLLAAPVREAWFVEPGAVMPQRPFPADPVRWLKGWRGPDAPTLLRPGYVGQAQPPPSEETAGALAHRQAGGMEPLRLVPVRYDLPSDMRRGPFVVELTASSLADPILERPHRGISLQVTEACMCRCIMCNIVGYFKQPMMPLARVLRTMTEAGLLGIKLLDLFGGEVTLRKDLLALLEQVRFLGMESMFITTGYYVDRGYAKRLAAAGVERVVVSIDGSRPEIHDPIRQLPGLWDKAAKAMRALAAEHRIETFASTVILSQNLEDLPDLIRLSAKCGIRKHEFFLPISGPISSTLPRWPDPEEAGRFLDRILPEMERVAAELGVIIDFRPEIRSWPPDRQRTLELISSGQYNAHQAPDGQGAGPNRRKTRTGKEGDAAVQCLAPGFNLFVTVNGNVYPCDMPALISRDTALGNLAETRLADLVNGSRMREFITRAGRHTACRMCVGRYEAVR